MKISVSLSEEDVAFLDRIDPNRSSALRRAIEALRERDLIDQYADADAEWAASGESAAWDGATGDGLA